MLTPTASTNQIFHLKSREINNENCPVLSSKHCGWEAASPAIGQSSKTHPRSQYKSQYCSIPSSITCKVRQSGPSASSDSAKPEVVDISKGYAAIKRNLDRLRQEQKIWSAIKRKCEVLFLWRNTRHQCGMGAKSQGSSFAKWDLTILVDKLTLHCALTPQMAQSNLTSPGQKQCFFPSVQY